jgi:hypothetical protein
MFPPTMLTVTYHNSGSLECVTMSLGQWFTFFQKSFGMDVEAIEMKLK